MTPFPISPELWSNLGFGTIMLIIGLYALWQVHRASRRSIMNGMFFCDEVSDLRSRLTSWTGGTELERRGTDASDTV